MKQTQSLANNNKKKRRILMGRLLFPLTVIGVALGVALPLSYCSCNNGDSTVTGYNMDGTNWDGYNGSGTLVCDINGDGATVTIKNADYYMASNLIIPDYVTDGKEMYKVTTIGDRAFTSNADLINNLTISNNIVSIGNYAFNGCVGFTGLTIGSGVTSIGTGAFAGCDNLTGSLTIPNNVTTIGDGAFEHCSGLTGSLTISNNVTRIGKRSFVDIPFSGNLIIPNRVAYIGEKAFEGCDYFSSLTIGNSVTNIDANAFGGCSGFDSIVGNFSVAPTVGNNAFVSLKDTGSPTVKNNSSSYNSQALLSLLQTNPGPSLPNNWIYI